jgi:carbon storage regulator
MLVLSRHRDESIVIMLDGRRVVVMVVAIRGDKVRLGIAADPNISIHRSEIQDRVDAGAPSPKWREGP